MQGQRSSITTLPENLTFDHGSTSTDVAIDAPIPWNSIPASTPQNILPDYRMPLSSSSSGSHIQYVQLGETSSRAPRHYEPSSILSSSGINSNINTTTNGPSYLVHNPIPTLPQDLNMIGDQEEEDDCRVIEGPTSSSYISIGSSSSSSSSSNEQRRSNGGSSTDSYCGYPMDVSEDGRRMSCKRKAHAGPSSGVGPSNCFQNNERRQWFHNIPPPQVTENNNPIINNSQEQMNSRLRLGVGGAIPTSPFSLTPSGNPETSRRNFRLRINGLYEQEPVIPENNPFPPEADVGNLDRPSSRNSSRLVVRNRLLDLNPNPNPNPNPAPAPPVENGNLLHGPPILHVPSLRRSQLHSRLSGGSHPRTVPTPSASAIPEEPISRNVPRSISEHPMFVPASHLGTSNLSQNHANWNLAGGSNNIPGNVASTSRVGSSGGSHRGCPQYPRRLSEIVRRSLASSPGVEHGGQSSNFALRSGSSSGYQEMPVPAGPDGHGLRATNSRSALLERHLEGAFGIPYSLRTLAAAGEGRSSIMSEIRHVLDLMRRGEGLRFEDVMILDHSVLFGMADIHDRHRDMRLDVDNMSYEELLALEERIGNVCTGLNEETILSHLKQKKYADNKTEDQTETEPCSICREEYDDGEDLGTLECGHDFHRDCIKQWLMQKNLCPICKTTGLTT